MKTKICKKHGELTPEQCMTQTSQKGRYKSVICRLCHNESGKAYRDKNKEKEKKRRRLYVENLKLREKKEKICKKHGLVSVENITNDHRCGFCKKEGDKSTKEKYKDRIKERDHNRYLEQCRNRPKELLCNVHGKIIDDEIVQNGICRYCAYEKNHNYYLANKSKVLQRTSLRQIRCRELINEQNRKRTLARKKALRAHWLPDTVKECKKHGLLTINQVKRTQYRPGFYTTNCAQCSKDWMKNADAARAKWRQKYSRTPERMERARVYAYRRYKQDPKKYHARNRVYQKKRAAELADGYIKDNLKFRGFKKEDITPELIDIKRCLIKMKRIMKDRRKQNG